ncbi:MAG: hypothetical protein IKR19_02700 [Acholeplasmatales bacterium]|nr:hypothetical protein [Acholeplasmatales bacterium]
MSFIPKTGSANIPSTAYTGTSLIHGVSLKSGKTYDVDMSLASSVSGTIYVYIKDKDGNTLVGSSVPSGNITKSFSYTANADYNNAFISFETGVTDSVLVTATISEEGNSNKIDAIESNTSKLLALPTWSYKETAGYFNLDGTIHGEGAYGEKYTNKLDLTGFTQIDYYQNVGANEQFNAYVLYDEDGDVVGTRVTWYDINKTIIPSDTTGAKYIAFCYRTYGTYHPTIRIYKPVLGNANSEADAKSSVTPFTFRPCYDHLFVTRTGENVTIPHESLYHIRLSRLFGFNTIEANVAKTSDGVFIVNHLIDGKFGSYFHHVDNETDISDIAVNSVTWAWIETNVRYNSTIPQYQTRPCTLQEFLSECRQQNIIPFVTSYDSDAVKITKQIMGDNNYIAYGGNRTNNPNAIIYDWVTKSTKQDIVDYCESIGKPFIYGMANPTDFSDSDLQDIVNTLHKMGYWIGTSYADVDWYKYAYMGFDVNGTQRQINRIDSGNVCNYNSILGFDDFAFTDATEANGVLTYNYDGTLIPKNLPNTTGIYMFDIELSFVGEITISSIGEWTSTETYISDGSVPIFVCAPIINDAPALTIYVSAGTIIRDVKYKLSKI